ncbi:MFS general substrate transporter [Trametopsis cervina]|nr:MFS general substrate transporter [Trametopsis cervina]
MSAGVGRTLSPARSGRVIGSNELLEEIVNPHHVQNDTLYEDEPPANAEVDEDAVSLETRRELPWYKRPSPLWFLCVAPLASSATASTAAPRVEIVTELACIAYKEHNTFSKGNKTIDSLMNAAMMVAGGLSDADKKACAKEPRVQAAVAQLDIALMLTIGILSCMTTGWWGSLSDRYGRVKVLSVAVFGILITDVVFISTVHFYKYLPGGYRFLLVGALLNGLCGGLIALSATIHAYLADCTPQESRSRIFSLFLGLTYAGFGLGPTIGGIVVHFTGSPLSVFYISTTLHALYAVLVWFIVPESLSKRRQLEARKLKREEEQAAQGRRRSSILQRSTKLLGILAPLALFYPTAPAADDLDPLKRPKRDWNLLLLALAYGSTQLIIGSYTYKFQYTASAFGWTSEEIGYWLSMVGVTRALYLTAILPLCIKLFKSTPKTGPIHLPADSDESRTESNTDPETLASKSTTHHALAFDLSLAKVSIAIEVVSYTLLCFANSAVPYTLFTMVDALGAGFEPAVSSVALGLYIQRGGTESGKLFGALSVVQSLCTFILGPIVFGTTFVKTVAIFPKAIFLLAAGAVTLSFFILLFVRLSPADGAFRPSGETIVGEPRHGQDVTSVEPSSEVPLIIVEDVSEPVKPVASTSASP